MSDASELLARYLRQRRELGETEVILDRSAIDKLRAGETRSRAPAVGRPARDRPSVEASRQALPEHALPRAAGTGSYTGEPVTLTGIRTLEELGAVASGCVACRLSETRTQVVFSDGSPDARLVVVGEAPGADEDRVGRPFVGRAGKLLDQLLLSIGFPREAVYICNVIKCRPPGNRNPHPDEVKTCSPYLRGQLDHVAPRAILAVGGFAAQTLLESTEPIGRLRGSVHEYRGLPLVPTYHPAALLRNPGWIRPVWEDLQRLRAAFDS